MKMVGSKFSKFWIPILRAHSKTTRHLVSSRVTDVYKFSVISWDLDDAELIPITSLQIAKP